VRRIERFQRAGRAGPAGRPMSLGFFFCEQNADRRLPTCFARRLRVERTCAHHGSTVVATLTQTAGSEHRIGHQSRRIGAGFVAETTGTRLTMRSNGGRAFVAPPAGDPAALRKRFAPAAQAAGGESIRLSSSLAEIVSSPISPNC